MRLGLRLFKQETLREKREASPDKREPSFYLSAVSQFKLEILQTPALGERINSHVSCHERGPDPWN